MCWVELCDGDVAARHSVPQHLQAAGSRAHVDVHQAGLQYKQPGQPGQVGQVGRGLSGQGGVLMGVLPVSTPMMIKKVMQMMMPTLLSQLLMQLQLDVCDCYAAMSWQLSG